MALEQQGDPEAALRVLDSASEQRTRGYVASAAFWLQNEWQRARLNRVLGREDEATQIETELRGLLALADSDHPLLQLLSQQEKGAQTLSLQDKTGRQYSTRSNMPRRYQFQR